MKCGTSFFNTTLLKKNLLRFWPLWVVYGLIWVYILPLNCLLLQGRMAGAEAAAVTKSVTNFALNIPDNLQGGVVLALIFGILAAMAMFSYLFNNRSACMIHALPTRREGLFLTNYLSGLICLLAPNAAVWLLTLMAEAPSGYVNLYTVTVWLLGQSALCLFFYSFAVFCAMFTGHILALPAFYGILNCLVLVVSSLVDVLMDPFLYGYGGISARIYDGVIWFTPVVKLVSAVQWNSNFGGSLAGVGTLVVYTLAGLLLTGLALLVYRVRHVESAGDVVAIALIRPVFKYGVAVCSALCFGFWLCEVMGIDGVGGLAFSMLLWAAVGYFVAEMLLRKSFRVFRAWKGCAVLLVVVGLCMAALHFDLTGYGTRVPRRDQVVSVSVSGLRSYPNDTANRIRLSEVSDPTTIDRVLALHRTVVDEYKNGEEPGSGTNLTGSTQFNVDYQLRGGGVLSRNYHLYYEDGTKLADDIGTLALNPALAWESYGLDQIDPDRLSDVWVSSLYEEAKGYYSTFHIETLEKQWRKQAMQAVYTAALQDLKDGNLGRRYLYDNDPVRLKDTYMADLCFEWEEEPITITRVDGSTYTQTYTRSISITLTPQAQRTIGELKRLGVITQGRSLRTYGEEHAVKFSERPIIAAEEDMEIHFQTAEMTAVSIPVPVTPAVVVD